MKLNIKKYTNSIFWINFLIIFGFIFCNYFPEDAVAFFEIFLEGVQGELDTNVLPDFSGGDLRKFHIIIA